MASGQAEDLQLDLREGVPAAQLSLGSELPSTGIHSEPYDTILPHTLTKRVVSGEWILRVEG